MLARIMVWAHWALTWVAGKMCFNGTGVYSRHCVYYNGCVFRRWGQTEVETWGHVLFSQHTNTRTHRDKALQCPPTWWLHFRGPLRSRNSVMEALSSIHLSIVSVINVTPVSSKSLCSIKLIFKSTHFNKAATPFAEHQFLCLCLRGSRQLSLFNLNVQVSAQTTLPWFLILVFLCSTC